MLPVMTIQGSVTFQCFTLSTVNCTDKSFETISHERYMTAPFHVAGQVTQSDTKSSKHHHWNGDCWRQKCAILFLFFKQTNKKSNMCVLTATTRDKTKTLENAYDLLKTFKLFLLTTTLNQAPTIRPIL